MEARGVRRRSDLSRSTGVLQWQRAGLAAARGGGA